MVHLVVLGGGRSSIGGDCSADCSMMLFSRFSEDLGRGQKDCPLMANCVGEIGLLPLHNSERGHPRLSSGDLCRRCEFSLEEQQAAFGPAVSTYHARNQEPVRIGQWAHPGSPPAVDIAERQPQPHRRIGTQPRQQDDRWLTPSFGYQSHARMSDPLSHDSTYCFFGGFVLETCMAICHEPALLTTVIP